MPRALVPAPHIQRSVGGRCCTPALRCVAERLRTGSGPVSIEAFGTSVTQGPGWEEVDRVANGEKGLPTYSLSYPAALHARDVLGLRRAGVGAMDEKAVLGLVEACGLGRHAKAFAENRVDGECLLEVAEAEFVEDLHMAPADARFLALALGWWEKTTSWA